MQDLCGCLFFFVFFLAYRWHSKWRLAIWFWDSRIGFWEGEEPTPVTRLQEKPGNSSLEQTCGLGLTSCRCHTNSSKLMRISRKVTLTLIFLWTGFHWSQLLQVCILRHCSCWSHPRKKSELHVRRQNMSTFPWTVMFIDFFFFFWCLNDVFSSITFVETGIDLRFVWDYSIVRAWFHFHLMTRVRHAVLVKGYLMENIPKIYPNGTEMRMSQNWGGKKW